MNEKTKVPQIKYCSAATIPELETIVNNCLAMDNRWAIHGDINVFDKPDVTEPVTFVQTLIRYVPIGQRHLDSRPNS